MKFDIRVFAWIILMLFLVVCIFFQPLDFSAECSLDGLNFDIDGDLNFTGFDLNDSRIDCAVSGELPLIVVLLEDRF